MAVTATWHGPGMKDLVCSGTILAQQGVFGAALCMGYAPDFDAHHFLTSAMPQEVTAGATVSGYTTFGATVTASTVIYDATNNEVQWHGTVPAWTGASFSATQMVLYYRFGGGTTTNWPILMTVDFGGTMTVSSGTFAYNQNTAGFGAITVF